MSATNGLDLQQARQVAEQITQRAKSDPSFMQQLRDDPAGTVKAAGMPEEAIGTFLAEEGLAEVSGCAMVAWCVCTGGCYTSWEDLESDLTWP